MTFYPGRPPFPAEPRIRTVPGAAPVTRALIVINVAVFLLEAIAGSILIATFARSNAKCRTMARRRRAYRGMRPVLTIIAPHERRSSVPRGDGSDTIRSPA
jgi:hypothetical protein